MARFVLLLLLVVAGALVIALVFDNKSRRDTRFDRLRWAFLHGRPLAGYSRPASLMEFVHPGGMRFRAPASWAIEMVDGERTISAGTADGGRRVRIEVLRLEGPASGSAVEALKSLEAEGERSVEVLPNGHALMKSLDAVRDARAVLASYTWHLGRAEPGRRLEIAVFRLRLSVESAGEVIAQSDLATLDREVREASFVEATSPPPADA
jgi:hypothetical protein